MEVGLIRVEERDNADDEERWAVVKKELRWSRKKSGCKLEDLGLARPRDLSSDHRRAELEMEPSRFNRYLFFALSICSLTWLRKKQKMPRRAGEG